MPPGVYEYRVKLSIPYRGQYFWSLHNRFGGPPDYDRPTGVFKETTEEIWIEGTVALNPQPESPYGAGWLLDGQQRLYEDEAGQILISDGTRNDRMYHSFNDLLKLHASDGVLVWVNYDMGEQPIRIFPENLARNWLPEYENHIVRLDAGNDESYTLTLSKDGQHAYVAAEGGETISIVNLSLGELSATIPVEYKPAGIALSPDERFAYVVHHGYNEMAVVDLSQRKVVDWILLDNSSGWSDITLTTDGRYAYVVSRYYADGVAVVDLNARAEVARIDAGSRPSDVALSPDDTLAYVVNSGSNSLSVLDLRTRQEMTHESDENGNITEHIYDQYGRIMKVIELVRGGMQPEMTFTTSDTGYPLLNDSPVGDPDNPAPAVPTSDDLVSGVQYGRGGVSGLMDKWGRWLHKTDGLGRTTSYERDEAGNLLRRDYPDGSCDEYSYDRNGKLLHKSRMGAAQCALPVDQRDPLQVQTTFYAYENRFNRIKTKVDPMGNITTYVYDYEEDAEGEGVGNLIRIEYPPVEDEYGVVQVPAVSYTYNAWGLVDTETDPRGTVTRYVYTQGIPDEADGGATPLFAPGVTRFPGC